MPQPHWPLRRGGCYGFVIEMEEHRTVEAKRLGEALVALDEDEFVRLPRAELRKRIARILG